MVTVHGRKGAGFRRIGVGRCLVATLFSIALLLNSVPFAAAAGRPLVTGIASLEGQYDPISLGHTKATGAQLVRVTVQWRGVAPSARPPVWQPEDPGDPNYNWTEPDLALTRVIDAGLTPVLLVDGPPTWALGCQPPAAVPGAVCDPDPTALASFATAAAHRYSGHFGGLPRVRYWQGLNEPNLGLFFQPLFVQNRPASPALYRKLINAFYFAVKSGNQSNLVVAAGLGPIARPHWAIGPMRFTRELLCMAGRRDPHPAPGTCEGGVHFDIFDIHPYTTGSPIHTGYADDVELGDLPELRELLEVADRAGRIKGSFNNTSIWNTEFSWDSKPPDPGGLPMNILSRWTAEALYRSWDAGVSRFFWVTLRDPVPTPSIPFHETAESGLYFRGAEVSEDRPKTSMRAFRFPFVAYSRKAGFFFWGRTPDNSAGGKGVIQIQDHGHWKTVSVARADRNGIFRGMVETLYGRNEHGAVRARFGGETAIPFSLQPVKDFYQPPAGARQDGKKGGSFAY